MCSDNTVPCKTNFVLLRSCKPITDEIIQIIERGLPAGEMRRALGAGPLDSGADAQNCSTARKDRSDERHHFRPKIIKIAMILAIFRPLVIFLVRGNEESSCLGTGSRHVWTRGIVLNSSGQLRGIWTGRNVFKVEGEGSTPATLDNKTLDKNL